MPRMILHYSMPAYKSSLSVARGAGAVVFNTQTNSCLHEIDT